MATQKKAVVVSNSNTSNTAGTTGSGSPAGSSSASIGAVASVGVSAVPGSTAGIAGIKPRPGFRESLQDVLQGIESVIPDDSTIPGPSGGFAKAAIVTQLQQWLALYGAVDALVLQLKGARLNLTDATPQAHATFIALKAALQGLFGPGSPQLTQFGFTPKTARAKGTSQELATAAVRSSQTRTIRGTLGPAQRKKAPKFTGPVAETAAATVPATTGAAEPQAQPATGSTGGAKTTA